jgi:hypothetical protein
MSPHQQIMAPSSPGIPEENRASSCAGLRSSQTVKISETIFTVPKHTVRFKRKILLKRT